ncbi:hypothetical protein MMPV_001481 [Pyropia vietnamensis]
MTAGVSGGGTTAAATVRGGSLWAGVNAALLKRVPTKALAAAIADAAIAGVSAAASAGTAGGNPSSPPPPSSLPPAGRRGMVKRQSCRMPGAPSPFSPRREVVTAASRLPGWTTPSPCPTPSTVPAPTAAVHPLVTLAATTAATAAAVALTYPLHAAYYAATRSVGGAAAGATGGRLLPTAISFLVSAPRSALYAGLGPAVAAAVAVPATAAPLGCFLPLPRVAVTIAARVVGEPLRAATRAAAAGGGVPLELYKGFGRRCVRYAVASVTAESVRSALRRPLSEGGRGAAPVETPVAPFALR